ncbi:hypothetical protein Pelo_17174 [Pelomyxa schiedti]|nr:hypothetical protein Pelo_17174 [Pelomyxa schiedti]
MKWVVVLCVVASATTNTTDCTYDDYMSWSVVDGNRYMTVVYPAPHDDSIVTVTVRDHSLGSLEFTGALDNTMCNYWSSNHNGWNLTTSGTNGCVRTVTKDFDSDEYSTHCAFQSGYQLNTVVKELTDAMYSGTNIDGTINAAVLNGVFNDVLLLPTTTSIYVYDPGDYLRSVGAYCWATYDTDYCDVNSAVYAPYQITGINPKPLSWPTSYVNDAVVLTTEIEAELHEISTATGTVTMYPKSNCRVYGNFTIQFLVACLDYYSTCNADTLDEFPFFNAIITIGIPNCETTAREAEAWLTMRTYNEEGEFDASFRPGTRITIEENITTTGGTPGSNCSCITDMFIYDWAGNLIWSYDDIQNVDIFFPESLVVSPVENKFSVYLDPYVMFTNPDGDVVQLVATCQVNWGFKKETVSFGNKYQLRDSLQSSGTAELTVGVDTDTSDKKLARKLGICFSVVMTVGVFVGLCALCQHN